MNQETIGLYPLLFKSQFKDKIWGGQKIKTHLGKDFGSLPNCGETWEISAVKGNISEVRNGILCGIGLDKVISQFKERLVGKAIWDKYGEDFPLLIKFIDANDDLSIQVHPDDALAQERHQSFGKTEMWYIIQADAGSKLNSGFSKKIDKSEYIQRVKNNTIEEVLNIDSVEAGDVFYLPAGRVHYIGKGILLAEIQQTSDITYRIYDFDRVDALGNKRELHVEQSADAIDFTVLEQYKSPYEKKLNSVVKVVSSPYFETNIVHFDKSLLRDYSQLRSFVIHVCTQGSYRLEYKGGEIAVHMGDAVLIPAEIHAIKMIPEEETKILETWAK